MAQEKEEEDEIIFEYHSAERDLGG